MFYFEYYSHRGNLVGHSDVLEWTDYKIISECAYNLIWRVVGIWTVVARDAETGEELGRWGM